MKVKRARAWARFVRVVVRCCRRGAAHLDRLTERGGDSRRFWLVSPPSKKIFNLLSLHPKQKNPRRHAPRGVHPQVERDVVLPREAALRVVELHGGDAEVGEDDVRAALEAFRVEELSEARVVAPHRLHGARRAEVRRESLEPRRGLRQLDGVDVHREEPAARQDPLQDLRRVASVAERGVYGDVARLGRERLEHLGDEDGHVAPRGRLARGEDFRAGPGEAVGVVLLVLLPEAARVRSGIARAPLTRGLRSAVRHRGRSSGLPTASGSATPSQRPRVGARSYGVVGASEVPALTAPQKTSGTWMSYS